jgi:chromosome segregation ATPase
MNNKLQEIKERVDGLVGFENASDDDLYYMSKGHINWLISQAEKAERLQKENERLKNFLDWEQEESQGLDEEVTFQLEQLKRAQEEIERLEKRYEFASQVEYELRQERQQLQLQLQQARESILETLDLLKRGGPRTRSQVQVLLEKVLEETK